MRHLCGTIHSSLHWLLGDLGHYFPCCQMLPLHYGHSTVPCLWHSGNKSHHPNWHDLMAEVVDINAELVPRHIKATNNRGDLLQV